MPLTATFYAQLRTSHAGRPALFPIFTQQQVDALNAITAVFDSFIGHDHCADDLAYVMATCLRECGHELNLSVEEYGWRTSLKAYAQQVAPYWKRYYGRGPCQITWLANYQKAKLATGIDFVQFPELMCRPAQSLVYMLQAMYAGSFTKHSLRNYITPGKVTTFEAFVAARHVINGTDHAEEVAHSAVAFQEALRVGYSQPVSSPSKPSPQSQQPRMSLWAGIRHIFGGK